MKGIQFVFAIFMLAVSSLSLAVEVNPVTPAGAAETASQTARINLNTADANQLQELKGVGPKTAESIVAWREANGPFTSVDQLLAVKGIGEKTLAKMQDQLTVQ
ncbi:competence protein ComEA-like protein with helix-hairpin-helix repeat region [Alcanivorax nanhaiticus]|uniref:Competence protein ComEA-like protein with helix-hairpin-helix repeat region n=1 Tax=Alcanivorax nanhaiticus TaxID=1177154 RepID=A0A095TNP2_9GAMM|nr:helix-hairpin-helix domain-containing protein [Alcanivorax nanhaiticus]KGD64028.1 competence protein ComEA-like protein with helix-hairpin-helix repeat region [Alcanivorax nanhaiticus]